MSRLNIVVPGTIATPRLGKNTPLDFVRNSDGSSPLYAGYMFGTDFTGTPLGDLSGNNRAVSQVGAGTPGTSGMQGKGFKGSGSGPTLLTPFTLDQLYAAGTPGEMAIVAFGLFPTGAKYSAGNSAGSANARRIDTFGTQPDGTLGLIDYDDVGFAQGGAAGAVGSGAQAYMLAYSSSATVLASRQQSTALKTSYAIARTTGGGRTLGGGQITMGSSGVSTYGYSLWSELYFSRVPTEAELDTIFAKMKALLGTFGIAL